LGLPITAMRRCVIVSPRAAQRAELLRQFDFTHPVVF
jgi:hypothetical protein